MFNEKELHFQCPYCFSPISFVVETFYSEQDYIEDCEVCCQPIQIRYQSDGEEVNDFTVDRAQ